MNSTVFFHDVDIIASFLKKSSSELKKLNSWYLDILALTLGTK